LGPRCFLSGSLDVRVNVHSQKGFFRYISSKQMTRENVGPLLNEMAALVREDTEKAELLNAFFVSIFTAKAGPQESQALGEERKPTERMTFPWSRRTV